MQLLSIYLRELKTHVHPKKKKKSNVCCNIICNSQNVEIIRNHSVTNNGTYQGPIIGRCIEGEKAHRAFIPRGEDRKY